MKAKKMSKMGEAAEALLDAVRVVAEGATEDRDARALKVAARALQVAALVDAYDRFGVHLFHHALDEAVD